MRYVLKPEVEESIDCFVSRFVKPGELYFCEENCQIHTILGSCIAVTLWHPILKIGGMCHFVHPGMRITAARVRPEQRLDGRYADEAMALMESEVLVRGTNLKEYQAKIFGGSNMLTSTTLADDELIGTRNAEVAIKLLYDREIPVLVAHVGETGHRRIVFDVNSGDVWVKFMPLQKLIPQKLKFR